MKICHITSAHPHTSTRIFIKECQTLAHNGFETYLVAPNAPDVVLKGVNIKGVTVNSRSRLLRMTKTVIEVYKKSLEINAEVYHFHDPELIFVGYLLKKKGKQVIYDVHEDVPTQILYKQWIPKTLRSVVSNTFKFVENSISKKFDGIITATPLINDRFKAIGCNTENINNYPILAEFDQQQGDQVIQKENSVCYVGGITYVRGIKEMVSALPLCDANLLLAGNFLDNCNEEEIKELEGWNKVVELGYVDRTAIQTILQKSKAGLVVLHPIRNYIDSLPIKMFEYMSSGLPVISSNFPLWKQIINDAKCGICIDPLNPKEIAEAIQWIIDNPEEARKMGENGKRMVRTKYNWEAEELKLVAFYHSLS